MTTGNVKMVAPTESTHVCGLKKIIWKLKKNKQENVLLTYTYIWKQANIELVPIKNKLTIFTEREWISADI